MLSDNKRIFIIDDDSFWANTLSKILHNLGYEKIYTFSSSIDAVNHLHLNPALIFLDYQMDNLDGLQVLNKVKDYFPAISVIFCTAHEDLGVAIQALEKGSSDFLLKSNLQKNELKSMIEAAFKQQDLILNSN